jgi:predicted metal-dependent hydrolase
VTSSSFANWALKLTHANRGSAVIRVNRLLRAPKQHVSDEVLAYLLFHELLHHLLPGQGHDAEFRANEAMWPDAEMHDAWFDTLHESWDIRPESYSGDVARP